MGFHLEISKKKHTIIKNAQFITSGAIKTNISMKNAGFIF